MALKFVYLHTAKMFAYELRSHRRTWEFIDQWESAVLFPDVAGCKHSIKMGCNFSPEEVEIDTKRLMGFGKGLLVHNHPNNVSEISDTDWEFARLWGQRYPNIEYGLVTPDFKFILYQVVLNLKISIRIWGNGAPYLSVAFCVGI